MEGRRVGGQARDGGTQLRIGGPGIAAGVAQQESAGAGLRLDPTVLPRRTGLVFPGNLHFDSWRRLGRQIDLITDSSAWWLGDWLVYGEKRYPDRYQRALENVSLGYKTLRNYAWVARKIPFSRRREQLSFGHHAEVAATPEHEQEMWLSRAQGGDWTRSRLRREIRLAQSGPELDAGPGDRPSVLALPIDPDQRERWQLTAERIGLSLVEWITELVDRETARLSDGPP
jgi:hypothetical protein